MKKFYVQCMAILTALVFLVGIFSVCVKEADSNVSSSSVLKESVPVLYEAGNTETTASKEHSNADGKEETVYITADAYGNKNEVTSSIRLINKTGSTTLDDVSSLADIESVKEDTTFEQNGENITWNAGGSDIYYQGTTDKALPLTIKIDYELDGKKTDPEALAGANGHLKIRFTYKNNTAIKRMVNGKEVTLYQPFVVMSGLMMKGDKASNVEISGGRAVSTADNSMVMGIAMPGLKESLGIDKMKDADGKPIDMDIPEDITIEADVKDFELITTITIVDNSLLEEMDLEKVDSIDDLRSAIRDLKSASSELKDGSAKLTDGVSALNDGANEFKDSTGKMDDAMDKLKEGADGLKDGASQLKDGTEKLPDGAASLYNGALALKDALKGNKGKSIYEGVEGIESGAGEISKGLKSNDAQKPGIYEAADGIKEGAQSISEGAADIATGAEQIKTELSAEMSDISSQIETLHNIGIISDELYFYIKSALDGYNVKMEELYAALDQIKDGATDISKGAKSDDPKNPGIYEAAGGVQQGADELKKGSDKLKNGAGSINKAIDEITNDENMGALIDGLKELENGATAIDEGAGALKEGSEALSSGLSKLKEGTEALASGSGSLTDGIAKLLEGAKTLSDGMAAFDEEGMSKLEDLSEGDLSDLIERLKALKEYASEYDTFSGKKEGTPGSVQFIFRTEAIE